jgi:hypothetical protein
MNWVELKTFFFQKVQHVSELIQPYNINTHDIIYWLASEACAMRKSCFRLDREDRPD